MCRQEIEMTRFLCHCEKCGASNEDGRLMDIYGDFDDEPGQLICDPCIEREFWEANPRGSVQYVMPERPEGYYHSPIGTFD